MSTLTPLSKIYTTAHYSCCKAAVYGAGVWAHSPIDSLDMRGVTCSVSGR